MPVQPIDPVSDARVEHRTAELNGQTYHYLYAVPKGGEFEHTIFLVSLLPTLSLVNGGQGESVVAHLLGEAGA
jgi:soluble epoxide hydrolase/lipid-phosphate phosphatase